jgi:hypothetical protein
LVHISDLKFGNDILTTQCYGGITHDVFFTSCEKHNEQNKKDISHFTKVWKLYELQKYLFLMELDINFLIDFFRKHSYDKSSGEIGEADEAGAAGGTTGSAPAGKTPKKWESGVSREGPANQIAPTSKWPPKPRTFGKTYMNDPKYVWTSGRTIGKTGGSDYA